MRTELVEDALAMAFANRAPQRGVIFHSDRGCQYTSGDFAELARTNGVVLSVGRKGQCWDNAVAESFFATIKRELIDTRSWPTRIGLRRGVFEYIEGWYNTPGCTRRSVTSARPNTKLSTTTPTVRRHNQHNQPVRRTGSSPGTMLGLQSGLDRRCLWFPRSDLVALVSLFDHDPHLRNAIDDDQSWCTGYAVSSRTALSAASSTGTAETHESEGRKLDPRIPIGG